MSTDQRCDPCVPVCPDDPDGICQRTEDPAREADPQFYENENFHILLDKLLDSYTPLGAVTWLTSPNAGLNSRRPIDKWTMGYEEEVQAVADLIDGGSW